MRKTSLITRFLSPMFLLEFNSGQESAIQDMSDIWALEALLSMRVFHGQATLAIRHESDSGNNLTQVHIDIPLPMRLKFGHFFFSFGPFLSANLYDSADRMIPEAGALVGMGITSSSIDIEARMTEGITDVYATSGYDDDDTFSKTLQFQILFSRWL